MVPIFLTGLSKLDKYLVMNFLDINQVKKIHIEHTSKCNLLCPQCARVFDGKVAPSLELDELTVDDYKSLFTEEFVPQIDKVWWCGNFGDPIASNTFMDSAKFLKSAGIPHLEINTNGSARSKDWWQELAGVIDRCVFSIDGLKDTNHVYRVNSNWDKIIENVKSYIDAGGTAHWDYLIFDHNVDQLAEAKNLATDLGFQSMSFKNTSRFVTTDKIKQAFTQVKTKKKNYSISSENNPNKTRYEQIVDEYGSFENYVDVTDISCKYKNNKVMYIDYKFKVWPCCWLGAPTYFHGDKNIQKKQIRKLESRFEKDFNSLRKHDLKTIFNHDWFANSLADSWNNTMADEKNPKLFTCGRTCGTSFEFSSVGNSNETSFRLN